MTDFWMNVLAGIVVAIIAGLGGLTLKRLKQYGDKTGQMSRLLHWLQNNWAYLRRGFRFRAALFIDHSTLKAEAVIYKRAVDVHKDEKQLVRVWDVPSGVFQLRAAFAAQVYRKTIEWCAMNGWSTIEFTGYTPPSALVLPGQTKWTVKLANANGEMCVVIQPGWCPVPRLPDKRIANAIAGASVVQTDL